MNTGPYQHLGSVAVWLVLPQTTRSVGEKVSYGRLAKVAAGSTIYVMSQSTLS